MERTLVIDAATPACSVALFDGTKIVDASYAHLGRGHAERLVPMIQALPDNGQASAIWVNVGPGSFTGIRVGISAARALALAWDIPCHGYSCLAMVAAIAKSGAKHNGPIDIAMQGGHGEFFFQAFDGDGHAVAPIASLIPAETAKASRAPIIAGSAAEQMVELRPDAQALELLPDARHWPLLDKEALPPSAAYIRGADAKLPAKKSKGPNA